MSRGSSLARKSGAYIEIAAFGISTSGMMIVNEFLGGISEGAALTFRRSVTLEASAQWVLWLISYNSAAKCSMPKGRVTDSGSSVTMVAFCMSNIKDVL